jgi:hypothetical protein
VLARNFISIHFPKIAIEIPEKFLSRNAFPCQEGTFRGRRYFTPGGLLLVQRHKKSQVSCRGVLV